MSAKYSFETRTHDVLVIGAGGAGLRAAIAASQAGASVGLICKSLLGKAHTVMAEGGVAASLGNLDSADNWQVHFADTMRGGQMINDWRMVEVYAKEVPERVYELERWGALFDRTPEGKIMQRPFGAHSYRRLCHVGDRTGLELIRTMQDRAVTQGLDIYQELTVTRLFMNDGRLSGAFTYARHDGRFIVFSAKAVVLATGGFGKIYKVTSNSWESTGDGVSLAYDAGADLRDMEMVQFHPTGMVWPPGVRGILVTEGVRGEGGLLFNNRGERFMEVYDPIKKDLSSRDVVARAITSEVNAGRGSEHGGVYLDITHRGGEYVKQKLPHMYEQFRSLANVDITKEPMEVAPTIHYAMGGVRVEAETAATTVPGLFAAGEVAAGLHGANRLGGNSLGDILVFGKRAGEAAAAYALGLGASIALSDAQVTAEEQRVLAPYTRDTGENPYLLQQEIQEIMTQHAPIVRDDATLREGLQRILDLQERVKNVQATGGKVFNPGWHTALDVRGMALIAEAVLRSAIERTECRGAHWRSDHPGKSDEMAKVNFITFRGPRGDMQLSTIPVPEMPAELAILFQTPAPAPTASGKGAS